MLGRGDAEPTLRIRASPTVNTFDGDAGIGYRSLGGGVFNKSVKYDILCQTAICSSHRSYP